MKSSLVGLLAGLTFTVSANADIISTLIESKNYDAIYLNQDLTTTIAGPKFSNPTGEGALPLAADSNLDGVCQLYGFKSFVANSLMRSNETHGQSVVINASSKFAGFKSLSEYYAIETLTCNSTESRPVPLSVNHSGRYANDDGSVTIKLPRFAMSGVNLLIYSESNLNGVCRLYGLSEYVAGSLVRDNAPSGLSVHVDENSHFQQYKSLIEYFGINSLMCR